MYFKYGFLMEGLTNSRHKTYSNTSQKQKYLAKINQTIVF